MLKTYYDYNSCWDISFKFDVLKSLTILAVDANVLLLIPY